VLVSSIHTCSKSIAVENRLNRKLKTAAKTYEKPKNTTKTQNQKANC